MTKKLVAAFVASALIAPLAALAESTRSVSLYGRAHATLDWLDDGADDGLNANSNSSRLGFRASHDLNDDLKAIMQVEQEIRRDRGDGHFAFRDSFLGLQGGFGMVRLGFFDTPLKAVRSNTDFFGDQIGDARNLTRLRDGYSGGDLDFDTRFRNGIQYRTPSYRGWTVDLHYSTNTDTGHNLDGQNRAISTSVSYGQGPWYLAAAYERKQASGSSALRLGAKYTRGALSIAGLAQIATVKGSTLVDDQDVKVFGIGASYKLGKKTTLKGQFYTLNADGRERDANMIVLGVDYQIARPFRLLFAYAGTSNDDNVRYGMSRGGHGGQQRAAAPGLDPSGLSVGFRYDF